jgi:hypothetical protein
VQASQISIWLRQRCRRKAVSYFFEALIYSIPGTIILMAVWGAGYLIAHLIQENLALLLQSLFELNLPYFSIINILFACLLVAGEFWICARNDRDLLSELPEFEYVDGKVTIFPMVGGMSAPAAGEFFISWLSDCLLLGPRLLVEAWSMFRKSIRLWHLDYPRCATILEAVGRRGKRVSFVELEQLVPDANRFHIFEQLRDIDGVVFLIREPAGVSLVEELRTEVRNLFRQKTQERREFKPPPNIPEPLTELEQCFKLLGLSRTASLAEIKTAYRKKIKECHPDRFSQLGKDWQKLAEERSKRLNLAYAEALASHR